MKRSRVLIPAILAAAAAAACATVPQGNPLPPKQEAFWSALRAHCGRAYEGRVALSTGTAGDTAMAGKRLVMHVRERAGPARRTARVFRMRTPFP